MTAPSKAYWCVLVCNDKHERSKELQKIYWESDQFIVVMNQSNVCGAKRLAGKVETLKMFNIRDYGLRMCPLHIEGDEISPKSRVWETCKNGPVMGFIVHLIIIGGE